MFRFVETLEQLTDLSEVKYLQISPAFLNDFFLTTVKVPKVEFKNASMSKREYLNVVNRFRAYGYDIVKETPEGETVLLYTSGKKLRPFHILLIAYDMQEPDKWECGRRALALYEYLDKYLIDPYNRSKIVVKKCAYMIKHQDATRIFDFKKGPDLIIGQQFATSHAYQLATDLKCMYIPLIYNSMGENMAVSFPFGMWSWEGKFVHPEPFQGSGSVNLQNGNFMNVQWDHLWDLVNFKISVLVPCHGRHINFLPKLLKNLKEMTKQPYEIVISISVPKNENIVDYLAVINSCKDFYPQIHLHISLTALTSAQNRNLASSCSKGDILVNLDADDKYHPQLLEIVYNVWKKHPDTMELHWFYNYIKNNSIQNNIQNIQNVEILREMDTYPKNFHAKYYYTERVEYDMIGIHHGHGAYAKELWEEIKWPEVICGEDFSYHRQILEKYPTQNRYIRNTLSFYYMENSLGLTNF